MAKPENKQKAIFEITEIHTKSQNEILIFYRELRDNLF
jgi:hypothetical protein